MPRLLTAFLLVSVAGCPKSSTPYILEDGSHDGPDEERRQGRRDGGRPDVADYDIYVDPGCEDGGAPLDADVFLRECDPYVPTTCGEGLQCYPRITYPTGMCGQEVFETRCLAGGGATQGQHCDGDLDCAGGYTCFVTGAGQQCLQLCDQGGGRPSCTSGLICGWTDLPGYGACF